MPKSFYLLLAILVSGASTASADVCARTVDEISRYPRIEAKAAMYGGVNQFIGVWDATGLKGALIPKATFTVENEQLSVQLKGYRKVRFHVCDAADDRTLEIRLIKSPINGVDTLFVRPAVDKKGNLKPARIHLAAKKIGSAEFVRIQPKTVPPTSGKIEAAKNRVLDWWNN